MADVPSSVSADSRIESVTVFESGAQVFRVSSVNIPKGVTRVTFAGLPATLKPDTVQVAVRLPAGSTVDLNSIVLKGIGVESVSAPNSEQKALVDSALAGCNERQDLERQVQRLQDRLAQGQSDAKFMDAMWVKASAPNAKAEQGDLFDMERWKSLIDQRISFAETSSAEERTLQNQIADLQERINAINVQVSAAASERRYITTQSITATLAAQTVVEGLEIQVSYMINEAKWSPAYDIRVDSAQSTIMLQYNGVASQWSSEGWTGVRLQLSTAKPHVSSQQPTLAPWHIALRKPITSVTLSAGSSRKSAECREECLADMVVMAASPALLIEAATSQSFVIAGLHSVINDSEKALRVSLVQVQLPASFSYVVVPKASENAFGLAKVINTTDYFLLAGPTSVYLNEQYIAKSVLSKVSPGESFSVDVGRDDGLSVSRKVIKRLRSEEGNMVTGKRVRHDFHFETKVVNKKPADVRVELREAVPVSGNGDISIKLISPELSEGESKVGGYQLDDEGILRFTSTIRGGGGEVSMTVAYRVTYPDDGRTVEGL